MQFKQKTNISALIFHPRYPIIYNKNFVFSGASGDSGDSGDQIFDWGWSLLPLRTAPAIDSEPEVIQPLKGHTAGHAVMRLNTKCVPVC